MTRPDPTRALEHLEEIRHHLNRSEVYRGYRPTFLLCMGSIGLAASAALALLWPDASPLERVGFWVAIASLNLATAAWQILGDLTSTTPEHVRRLTVSAVMQFLPAVVLGAMVTVALVQEGTRLELLRGLWAGLYGLGMVSSRPYLPPKMSLVAAYFFLWSAQLLVWPSAALSQPWCMGLAFGGGQILTAYVIYRAESDDQQ